MQKILEIISGLSKDAKNIFSTIQKRGPISKNELLDITGLKLTTLNRIMEPLEELKLVIEYGIGESSGGRKPVLFDVNPNLYYVVGVDLSRTYTQITIVNMKMKILFKDKFDMDESCTPQKTVEIISGIILESLNKLSIKKDAVLGIGVGAVGPLDRESGILINPVNFIAEGWSNVPIKNMLYEKLDLPIIIDNGANTAVIAEYFFGVGRGYKNIAYFNCGVGIRTGAITSDAIIRTINDAEDCFAHMTIDVDGEQCVCGNFGCVEAYSSIHSIVKKFIAEIKKGRRSIISNPLEDINYLDICSAAENNDELAKEVIYNAATSFGVGLANYINLLNPRMIILSGPLINHSSLFYETCKEIAYKKYYLNDSKNVVFSKEGSFKEDAISIGGAAVIIESILNNAIVE
jgi:predicted NBD/HSP70 family sugar kinase